MNKVLVTGLLAVVLGGSGCGTLRKGKRSKAPAAVTVFDTAMIRRPDTAVLAPVAGTVDAALAGRLLTRAPFQTFSAKAKAAYEADGDRKEFSMAVRIEAGKAIWVSVNALGGLVNVARAYITPDSIQAINYLQREAYRMPYSAGERLLPIAVPFETLQALLTGAPLFTASAVTGLQETPSSWLLQSQRGNALQTLTVGKSDTLVEAATFAMSGAASPVDLQLRFQKYLRTSHAFPRERTATILARGKRSSLQLEFDEPTWDQPVEMPFSIPAKYTLK